MNPESHITLALHQPQHRNKMLPENWIIITIATGFVSMIAYLWKRRDNTVEKFSAKFDHLAENQQAMLVEIRSLAITANANAADLNRMRTVSDVHSEQIADMRAKMAGLFAKVESLTNNQNSK